MGNIIGNFVNMVIGILNQALVIIGIDLSTINISFGIYSPWFEIDLYKLIAIIFTMIIWIGIIKITFNIFKGIYRRIKFW